MAEVITSLEKAELAAGRMLRCPGPFFVDIETTGTNPRSSKIVATQLSIPGLSVVVFDCRCLDVRLLGNILRPVLEKVLVVGMNFKFDYSFLRWQMGMRCLKIWDVMIVEQVLRGRGFGDGIGFSLDEICKRRGLPRKKTEKRSWFIELDKREEEWAAPFPPDQLEYMVKDVEVLETIYYQQKEELNERR